MSRRTRHSQVRGVVEVPHQMSVPQALGVMAVCTAAAAVEVARF
jgi:hypothetical protein